MQALTVVHLGDRNVVVGFAVLGTVVTRRISSSVVGKRLGVSSGLGRLALWSEELNWDGLKLFSETIEVLGITVI